MLRWYGQNLDRMDDTAMGSDGVKRSALIRWIAAAVALGAVGCTSAQGQPLPAPLSPKSGSDALVGAWSRTDGGYIILIRGVGAFGQLEASYFNPRPIPFAKAVALRDGDALRAKFELRDGGYEGSVYELTYDRASDRLTGSFYQAVAKQTFEVVFVRKKP
jgi:hypothetical protein